MDLKWLGLMGMVSLLGACGDDTPPTPPPTPKFHVGGTISGLSEQLTLQLNGAERLTRSTDGAFTFQTELEDKSAYSVTLSVPPSDHTCTLQGDTGTVNGADVSSVQVSCALKTYALAGTVTGLNGSLQLRIEGGETLTVNGSGPFTFQTRYNRGHIYKVDLVAQPKGHRCTPTTFNGTVVDDPNAITVQCTPSLSFSAFPTATVVLGQSTFTASQPNRGGVPSAMTLDGPWGNPVLAGGKLYVPDTGSNRILGFNGLPTQNGASAAFVLGQPGFTSGSARTGRVGLSGAEGLSSDGTRLAVADKGNSRVLIFSTLPSSTATEPDLVVGQPDFDAMDPHCNATSLAIPEAVSFGQGKLVVADSANHRVLIWNSLPTVNGKAADLVLGQTSFTSCAGNDTDRNGTTDSAPSASTLFYPAGVWTNGTRLLVADTDNHRVLVWNTFPTTNGQPADFVLGQPGFITRATALTAAGMNRPYSVTSTGEQIFVAEYQNNRVTVWNQFPSANGPDANLVLGQPDFTSQNRGDPSPGSVPSARSLYQPSGVLLAPPAVVVADYGNNRLLVFESQ